MKAMPPALVLAAGLGTRLDPITRLLAKPAVPLGDSTLIEHVLSWLGRQSVTDVVINLHHRPDTITGVVGDGRQFGLRVRYSWERTILGSAGGPKRALPLLDADPFLVVNGDTLCEIDLGSMLDAHTRSGADVTLAVVPNPAPDHYNGIVLDAEDHVCGFKPKGSAAGTWHFVGVQVCRPPVFDRLADGAHAETISALYPERMARMPGSVCGFRVSTRFFDVGTPGDYLRAALDIASRDAAHAPAHLPPGVVDSVVFQDARVAADVDLVRTVVVGPIDVPAGFRAREAVLVPASVVRPGDVAEIAGGIAVFALEPRA
jgi:NDP-sugar pyrophosphorylase family protein